MKKIETLFPDIMELFFKDDHKINEDHLKIYLDHCEGVLREFLETRQDLGNSEKKLRLSKIGTPNRKIWYEFNMEDPSAPSRDSGALNYKDGQVLMKFLVGHLTEAMLLFLAREAGHSVEYEQETVEIEGVEGHLDAVIDGHLTDEKTASFYGYRKFENGSLLKGDDPYGYIPQLSAYKKGLENKYNIKLKDPPYWWAINKSDQDMMLVDCPEDKLIDAEARVRELKEVIKLPEPPSEKCYDPVPFKKGDEDGNLKLHTQCNYCPFKFECWKDANDGQGLRTFNYSNGRVHFTKVVKAPRVEEIIHGEEKT